ncbi:MAG: hypothetical protein LBF22_14490 [Deltaproteobacteria bacterium]|jgi:hypothetical protein|nr:hypothetical protein [Deltaproteobacteria bacterium]
MNQKELEEFMYNVMNELHHTSAPLVFMGAMVLRQVLRDYGFTKVDRNTRDIDCNWIGSPPTMDDLLKLLTYSIRKYKDMYSAVIIRNYDSERTACLAVIDNKTNNQIFRIDIGIFPVIAEKMYYYGQYSFPGVLPNEMLCDKLFVLSRDIILRRAKDTLDVYLLANCISIDTDNIFLTLKKKSMFPLNSFDVFLNRTDELEHSYNKTRRIINKPDFKDVHSYLKIFLAPFILNTQETLIWDNENILWKQNPDNDTLGP